MTGALGQETAGGPDVWRNWRAWASGTAPLGAYEAVLYTDAHVTGETLDGLGPYRAFNALGSGGLHGPAVGAGVVLRVEQHHAQEIPAPQEHARTSTEHYVGAAPLSDQFACLLSLALGARFRSGGETREFRPDGDPRGRPGHWAHRVPALALPVGPSVLPDVADRTVLLDAAVPVLASLPRLTASEATRVVRAARLYRQALWAADDDPELSWLLLVSAAEVGATQWAGRAGEPTARLEETMPELAALLRERGGPELVDDAAGHLADLLRATARFLAFVAEFGSDEPPDRPEHDWAQVPWQRLKTAVAKVYAYRSAVLHAGEPFPAPLLEVPWAGDLAHPAERPLGLGTALGGTTWAAKDLPMHLHVFAGVVRRALAGWWGRLADGAGPSGPEGGGRAARP